MKNFEKWEKEVLDIVKKDESFGVKNGCPVDCGSMSGGISCDECDLSYKRNNNNFNCLVKRIEWLYSEYVEKPKLTKQERKFCELFEGKGYYIARDKDGECYGYIDTPEKNKRHEWCGNWFSINGVLEYADIKFDFIKYEDEKSWAIDDLLKLEVIDN